MAIGNQLGGHHLVDIPEHIDDILDVLDLAEIGDMDQDPFSVGSDGLFEMLLVDPRKT